MLWNAGDIISVIGTHYVIDPKTGDVTEKFGWTLEAGKTDHLRQAVYYGIGIVKDNLSDEVELLRAQVDRLAGNILGYRSRSRADKHLALTAKLVKLEEKLVKVSGLVLRIKDADDLPEEERNPILTVFSKVSDSVLRECRDWFNINFIDRSSEVEVNQPVMTYDPTHRYHLLNESSLEIEAYGVSIDIFRNRPDGGLDLTYLAFDPNGDRTFSVVFPATEDGIQFDTNKVKCQYDQRILRRDYSTVLDQLMEVAAKKIAEIEAKCEEARMKPLKVQVDSAKDQE